MERAALKVERTEAKGGRARAYKWAWYGMSTYLPWPKQVIWPSPRSLGWDFYFPYREGWFGKSREETSKKWWEQNLKFKH